MPYFIAAGSRLPLSEGETRIGGPEPALSVPGLALESPAALIWLAADGRATVRRLDSRVEVELYGLPVRDEPRPLAHGAKLVIAGKRLAYVDERAAGTTRHVSGVPDDALLDDPLAQLGEPVPTSDTGGRLVSLRDGRVYPIPEEGLDIGRDPHCDIVLDDRDVSRWHAEVAPGLLGYSITDNSSNGVLVDGTPVEGSRVLGQGNVIRIGSEELRFEADEARFEPERTPAPDESSVVPAGSEPAERPVPPRPPPEPLLATLEIINEGPVKGTRFRLTRPLAHMGRAPHNDVVLDDATVSASHATLQRRGEGWWVTDAASRNGTYIDGERVSGEARLAGPCELRCGNVKMVFRPLAGGTGTESGTRSVVGPPDERR